MGKVLGSSEDVSLGKLFGSVVGRAEGSGVVGFPFGLEVGKRGFPFGF